MIYLFVLILETSPVSCYLIFAENVLNKSLALVAVFGTNIEMSLDESKQLSKWLKIMFCLMSAVELVGVKI